MESKDLKRVGKAAGFNSYQEADAAFHQSVIWKFFAEDFDNRYQRKNESWRAYEVYFNLRKICYLKQAYVLNLLKSSIWRKKQQHQKARPTLNFSQ